MLTSIEILLGSTFSPISTISTRWAFLSSAASAIAIAVFFAASRRSSVASSFLGGGTDAPPLRFALALTAGAFPAGFFFAGAAGFLFVVRDAVVRPARVLLADAESDLGEEAAEFYFDDAADELIASGDFAKGATARTDFAAIEFLRNQAINFGFGDAMVAARSFGGFEFATVNPLLESGIADAEDVCRFARGEETLHGFT